ncbi:hypothetical protein T5B8_18403 [Salinisphaera sp. T5B8]
MWPGCIATDELVSNVSVAPSRRDHVTLQLTYKPVVAGVRDRGLISSKAHRGELTLFDVCDHGQRHAGIHAPIWPGDKDTAKRVADHLIKFMRRSRVT